MGATMPASESDLWFFVFFPFYFVGLWCLVCYTISIVGGWKRLARKYPRREEPKGRKFSMASASLGFFCNYNGCLTIHGCKEGVDLAVWGLFRIGHPPIFLPWSALERVTPGKFLWIKWVKIEVGSPMVTTLKISEGLYRSLREQA